MKPKSFACIDCAGYEWGQRQEFTEPEGSGALQVLILGESAGFFEAKDGLPFRPHAPAGSVLERALRRLGYSRSQFRIANIIQCRPPGDSLDGEPYETAVVQHCSVHRDKIVREMQPKCILALGGLPLRWLTGMTGKLQTISYLRGYVLDGTMYPDIPVVGTFHPSFLRQGNMALFGVLSHDIRVAVEVARSGRPTARRVTYITQPKVEYLQGLYRDLVAAPERLVSYDIETPTSADLPEDERDNDPSYQITQIQFSTQPEEAVAFPWVEPYIEWSKRILALPNPKVGHNVWNYDNPRLRYHGAVINGRVDDTLWMWHQQQPDLPAHLQFVASFYGMDWPWKHLNEADPAWYGCADADAVSRIMVRLPDDLRQRGIWEGYERHMYQLQPVLEAMSARGVPVNPEARQEFVTYLEGEEQTALARFRDHIPQELWKCQPPKGYVRVPRDTTGLVRRQFPVRVDVGQQDSLVTIDAVEERWCRLVPPVPSRQTLISYTRWQAEHHPSKTMQKEYRVPRHMKRVTTEGEKAETTEKRELMRLGKRTSDDTYRLSIEYRELQKARSTYADGWVGRDGRVHSRFTFSPATGQIAAHQPNVQNAPTVKGMESQVRKADLGRRFRRVIEAAPGHRLAEFDWRSFHTLTLGFEAQDKDLMRIARLDAHSFLAAEFLKLNKAERMFAMADDELHDYLAWIKANHGEVRDTKCKQANLGYGFGLQGRSLYQYNMEYFASEREAIQLVSTLDGVFPVTARYRLAVQHEAQSTGYLKTRFWSQRWFYDVLTFWSEWKVKDAIQRGRRARKCVLCGLYHDPGEQANEAIAYRPANDAFGLKKQVMLRLDEQGLLDRYRLINEVHDALLFEPPDELVEGCISTIKPEMERPSDVLVDPVVAPDGLWCAVTVKIGKDWATMEELQ